jgi:N-acetyl-anhydromuramoyl-L-alanine amidase
MQLDDDLAWLKDVKHRVSPNFSKRPQGVDVDMIVIHGISLPEGQFNNAYIDQLFTNTLDWEADPSFEDLKDLKVSAHVMINREGVITQYVSFQAAAWHAGVSEFQGRTHCNDFSIGIELEGDDHTAYTKAQYEILIPLVQTLCRAYPHVTQDRIVGHETIAPGRKTDPGKHFDWSVFKNAF